MEYNSGSKVMGDWEITCKLGQGTLQESDKNLLVELGVEFSQLDYDYDDMKRTLQRVTTNIAKENGVNDPIMETFEDLGEDVVSEDSILRGTGVSGFVNVTQTFYLSPPEEIEFRHYCLLCDTVIPRTIGAYEGLAKEKGKESESGIYLKKYYSFEPDVGDGSREQLIHNIEAAIDYEYIVEYHPTTRKILELALTEIKSGSTDIERIQNMMDAACKALEIDDIDLYNSFLDTGYSNESYVNSENDNLDETDGRTVYRNQETGIKIVFPNDKWTDYGEYLEDIEADAVYCDGDNCFLIYIAEDLFTAFVDAGYDYIAAEEIDGMIDEETVVDIMGYDDYSSIQKKQSASQIFDYYVFDDSDNTQAIGVVKNAILHLFILTAVDESVKFDKSIGYDLMDDCVQFENLERF